MAVTFYLSSNVSLFSLKKVNMLDKDTREALSADTPRMKDIDALVKEKISIKKYFIHGLCVFLVKQKKHQLFWWKHFEISIDETHPLSLDLKSKWKLVVKKQWQASHKIKKKSGWLLKKSGQTFVHVGCTSVIADASNAFSSMGVDLHTSPTENIFSPLWDLEMVQSRWTKMKWTENWIVLPGW